jgi:hypothetical protein
MVSSLSGLPAKDIYVNAPEFLPNLDLRKHPWYKNSNDFTCSKSCVIKSHELPSTNLHKQVGIKRQDRIHLVRDGRDVVVSKWFFETEFLPGNGILDRPKTTFDEFLATTAQDWSRFVDAWLAEDVLLCRYEDLLARPVETLSTLQSQLRFPAVMSMEQAVDENTADKTRKSLSAVFKHNTFVRSAKSGEWEKHFSPEAEAVFDRFAGAALTKLGYHRHGL